ncbi:MAG: acetylxylan esterase [Blastocatellia bacterium]|nr:acetylxylan esterase [Blastocatellia bacterium]
MRFRIHCLRRICLVGLTSFIAVGAVGGPFRASAQRAGELNFISELVDYRTIRDMLPAHLRRLVAERLAERKRTIARIASPEDVARRRSEVRAKILASIGGLPEKTPLNARVVGTIERDEYRIEKLIFESQPRFFVTANLYLPTRGRGPYPGILVPLGHEPAPKAYPDAQHLLIGLAQRGFAALAWDPIGQGERIQIYDPDLEESKVLRSPTEHAVVGMQCTVVGDNLARYMIQDGIRALDYLLTRPEIDPARIGCTGNSGGGNLTAYLAALDDRIHAAAPSCWLTSWDGLLGTIGPQDSEQTLFPFIAEGIDYPDFIYAVAPKPYLILGATRDFFSINGTRETYTEAKRIYDTLAAPEKLSMVEADDYHGYSAPRRLAAYRWFERWFKGSEEVRSESRPESGIELSTDQELRCTETGQVTTSLNSETVFSLNQKRAEQLRSQMRPQPGRSEFPAFQAEIRNRVRQSLNLTLPQNPVPVKSYGHFDHPGHRIEKLVYESEPGIFIPSLLYLPKTTETKRPAILYVHGRGKAAGSADLNELVAAGFVVLSIDVRGAGETMVIESQQSNDTRPYFGDFDSTMIALLLGKPLVGMRAADIIRGLDLLQSRAEVDPGRIYGFGKDDGAPPMLYAATLDERIRKIAIEGMLVSYQSITTHRIHRQVFEHIVDGALKSYDFPDLAAALAPRPTWIVNGADPIGRRIALPDLKKQYATATALFRSLEMESSLRIANRKDPERAAAFYRDWLGRTGEGKQ